MSRQYTPAQLASLHKYPKNIRNICVLAHVDHGKTTMCDNLIVSNGIISQRLAGKIRYMDSRPDEAQRQITMKSSSISLWHEHVDRRTRQPAPQPYLVNIIDSPGHVDFSSEVSTAVRITDGALVVVDVVEGVCIQTESVLRQAREEGVKPVLVMNKVDRLVLELNLAPAEAYAQLARVLTAVNAVCALLWKDDQVESNDSDDISNNNNNKKDDDEVAEFFTPAKGNVVFASAYHGWAFSIHDFAALYETKLGMKRDVLLKTLWGEYYLDPKTKQVTTKAKEGAVPMFAQFCLKQVWDVYGACVGKDQAKIEKVVSVLGLQIPPRELRTHDTNALVTAVFSRWLPLSSAVLAMAVEELPSPVEAQSLRLQRLCTPLPANAPAALVEEHREVLKGIAACDPEGPVVAFISKIFPSDDPGVLVEAQRRVRLAKDAAAAAAATAATATASSTAPPADGTLIDSSSSSVDNSSSTALLGAASAVSPFVAFCRIFSGTIRLGASVYLLGARFDPTKPERYCVKVKVEELYLLMGRALESLSAVPAGNVFGLGGVSHLVLKTATVSSSMACTPFSVMPTVSHPIVRVAVEPRNPYELPQLVTGLELLNQADPCVEVSVTEAGEHLLTAAGEIHLELCLRDLRERYAKIDVEASAPIVPFRESICNEPGRNPEVKVGEQSTADKTVKIVIQARPLPENVVQYLDKNCARVNAILASDDFLQDDLFRVGLEREMAAAGSKWLQLLPYLWAIGPQGVGTNMMFNRIPDYGDTDSWQNRKSLRFAWSEKSRVVDAKKNKKDWGRQIDDARILQRNAILADLDGTIRSGFLLASGHGPLCDEPMMGVCFVVVDVEIDVDTVQNKEREMPYGPLSGQMITTVNAACKQAFLAKAARLYEAAYECDVRLMERSLGKVSQVLGRRRAEIFAQDYNADNLTITLKALLPVRESFGLYQEMIAETSGAVTTQLMLHGWKLLDIDPFYVPKTEEELEDYGDNVLAKGTNLARQLLDEARRRKGLQVEEKLVEAAEKQRTLAKKK